MLRFMSAVLAEKVEDIQKEAISKARLTLSNFADRAASILQELAEYGENERVRMAAANSILDRVGVVTPQQIMMVENPEEHALVRQDAEEVLARLQRNMEQATKGPAPLSLEAIVVHESEELT